MEPIHQPECNNGFKCNSESIIDNNLYGHRGCIRMYINSAGNCYHKSYSGTDCITKHHDLYRTEYYLDSKRSEYIFLESVHIA